MTRAALRSTPEDTPLVRPRTRPHTVTDTKQTGVSADDRALELVSEYFRANSAANEAKAKADKAKKELDRLMSQNSITSVEANVDGVIVDAKYVADVVNEVDVEALHKLCGKDIKTFLSVVSATQKSVKDHLGQNVLNKVLVEQTKEPALKIKPRTKAGAD